MGTVWLAERTDGAFEKRVALKVVRGGLDSPVLVERFRAERRILARLEHPGIARILDGGETEDSLPYLVMEHVSGERVDEWVRRNLPSPRALVELFLKICDAVEYAHRSLVVHRDLKPANILVDDAGSPRLLDFGIAKLLEEDGGEGLTRPGGRPMTPEYAAPEQVRGEPVSTATDVYALGVLGYELLTGEPPFHSETGSARELETAILERDPEPPSRRAGSPSIAEDLDDVILMALRKSPADRYPTVAAFADDLRRWRSGHPVSARPPSFAYRAGKFVKRNALLVTVAIAGLFALLAGMSGLAVGLVRAQRAEEIARREAATAQEVVEFLTGLFRVSDPNLQREDVTAREILDEGAASIADLESEPVVMARLLSTMGIVYSELGAFESARDQFAASLAAREQALGPEHAEVAESLQNLANVEKILGRYDEAAAHYERSIEIKEERHGTRSLQVARGLYGLATLYSEAGDAERALPLFERVLAIQEPSPEIDPMELANTLNALAGVEMRTGELEPAMLHLERAIAILEELQGPRHPRVIGSRTNLAVLALENGEPGRAREICESTLPLLEEIRGPGHPHVATTHNVLGQAHRDLGDLEKAADHFERSVEIWEGAVGPDHPQVATSLEDLGGVRAALGDLESARRTFARVLAIREKAFGPEHPLFLDTRDRTEEILSR